MNKKLLLLSFLGLAINLVAMEQFPTLKELALKSIKQNKEFLNRIDGSTNDTLLDYELYSAKLLQTKSFDLLCKELHPKLELVSKFGRGKQFFSTQADIYCFGTPIADNYSELTLIDLSSEKELGTVKLDTPISDKIETLKLSSNKDKSKVIIGVPESQEMIVWDLQKDKKITTISNVAISNHDDEKEFFEFGFLPNDSIFALIVKEDNGKGYLTIFDAVSGKSKKSNEISFPKFWIADGLVYALDDKRIMIQSCTNSETEGDLPLFGVNPLFYIVNIETGLIEQQLITDDQAEFLAGYDYFNAIAEGSTVNIYSINNLEKPICTINNNDVNNEKFGFCCFLNNEYILLNNEKCNYVYSISAKKIVSTIVETMEKAVVETIEEEPIIFHEFVLLNSDIIAKITINNYIDKVFVDVSLFNITKENATILHKERIDLENYSYCRKSDRALIFSKALLDGNFTHESFAIMSLDRFKNGVMSLIKNFLSKDPAKQYLLFEQLDEAFDQNELIVLNSEQKETLALFAKDIQEKIINMIMNRNSNLFFKQLDENVDQNQFILLNDEQKRTLESFDKNVQETILNQIMDRNVNLFFKQLKKDIDQNEFIKLNNEHKKTLESFEKNVQEIILNQIMDRNINLFFKQLKKDMDKNEFILLNSKQKEALSSFSETIKEEILTIIADYNHKIFELKNSELY